MQVLRDKNFVSNKPMRRIAAVPIMLVLLFIFHSTSLFAQEKKPLELKDFGQWKSISHQTLSNDGAWVAYYVKPQIGDGKLVVHNIKSKTEYEVQRGTKPVFTSDNSKVAGIIVAPEDENGNAQKNYKTKMFLLNLQDGTTRELESVTDFSFSEDAKWAAIKHFGPDNGQKTVIVNGNNQSGKLNTNKKIGADLTLMSLRNGVTETIKEVTEYSFDKHSKFLAYAVASLVNDRDGLYSYDLNALAHIPLKTGYGQYTSLAWDNDNTHLALVVDKENSENAAPDRDVYTWDVASQTAELAIDTENIENFPEGMVIAQSPGLQWSNDSNSLLFNVQAAPPVADENQNDDELPGVDVWHWKDNLIQTQQHNRINRLKNKSFTSVYHLDEGTFARIADEKIETVRINTNASYAVGNDLTKIRHESPWYPQGGNTPGQDVYLINMKDGSRRQIVDEFASTMNWSPTGKYLYWFEGEDWHIYSLADGGSTNLTEKVNTEFRNILVDRPTTLPSWGFAGWSSDDRHLLVYDRYDIWALPANGGNAENITGGEGRRRNARFRYVKLDAIEKNIDFSKPMMLSFLNNDNYATGYYRLRYGTKNPVKMIEMDKTISPPVKAKNADVLLYSIQTFQEFPDLHVSDTNFNNKTKISDANPQQQNYLWGTAQLVEWNNIDGVPLKGVLFLPEDYVPGKRYPLVLYIYEKMSQTYHRYFPPIANHRFNATEYTSNGYAVLKPDIVYEKGLPGPSSVKSVVPAVQKIVDMGIADPERVGLQGHSWGGYEAAYIVTQTNIFAAACAGAPVSNMTSAYGGIRWGSGNPRTFQYETGQSRIGGNLWEKPELYIRNSPLFFADRVETPLLLMHGDDDGAVPWYQSIEYYLALRRLNKPSWFLQYNGEPHHLQKKKNKEDFTIKMFEFFEHFLKDKPAPEWLAKGVPAWEKGKK